MLLVRIHVERPLLSMEPASSPAASVTTPDPSPSSVYRWAIQHGWSQAEAGNWAAWCAGLPIVEGEDLPVNAWTVRAVEHLIWLRWCNATGRLAGDTEAGMPLLTVPALEVTR